MNVNANDTSQIAAALLSLKNVMDPEIGLYIVDMGLLYELTFDERPKRIQVLMTLSTRFCPMGESIVEGVTNNLNDRFPGYDVQIQVTFDPPWSYAMISPEGRNFLNK